MRRRAFITTLGCICAWPLSLRAQQAVPVVGLLRITSPEANPDVVHAFRQGLKEVGYVEGENLEVQYRWTDDQIDKLALLAADLVRRKVAVIVAASPAPALAAKAATTTTPIVFMVSADPVKLGLVTNLARPDGNLTGVNFFLAEMAAKRLELLRELVPAAARVAVLINPANAAIAEATLRDAEAAARAMKLELQVLNANTSGEIDEAFATLLHARADALMVSSGPFFFRQAVQMAQLASRYPVPTLYSESR